MASVATILGSYNSMPDVAQPAHTTSAWYLQMELATISTLVTNTMAIVARVIFDICQSD